MRLPQLEELVIEWCAKNKWMNYRSEEHDIAFSYFYNFFKQIVPGPTETALNEALRRLQMNGLLEVQTSHQTFQIAIIRGLTVRGLEYYDNFLA